MSITTDKCRSDLNVQSDNSFNTNKIIIGLGLGSLVIFGMSIVVPMMSKSYVSFTSISLSIIFLALVGTAVYLYMDDNNKLQKATEEYYKCVRDVNTAVEALAKAKAEKEKAEADAKAKAEAELRAKIEVKTTPTLTPATLLTTTGP